MKRSTDRILTTHVGSLIRPPALREFLAAKEAEKPFDQAAYAKCLKDCVAEVVRKQAEIGIDVISDGEFGKAISWAQYALFRLGGFQRRPFAAAIPSPAASTAPALRSSTPSSTLATKSRP
jgi:5-methyltetrahydropteroyltriglutamate--homocysteine methyltransferase